VKEMKVLAISGSPRKGNTDAMLEQVLKGTAETGAEVELVKLVDKKIGICEGCDPDCFGTEKGCHLEDDMQELYEKCSKADAIVLGSPNYFRNVSGIMKNFIDRWNAHCKPSKLKGKKAAIVMAGGQPEDNIKQGAKSLETFVEDMKMVLVGKVFAEADKPGKVQGNKEKMQQCLELGKKLVE